MEVFVYFFGPIGFLLFVNIVLFASTTRQLMCGLWNQDDVKSTTERYVTFMMVMNNEEILCKFLRVFSVFTSIFSACSYNNLKYLLLFCISFLVRV